MSEPSLFSTSLPGTADSPSRLRPSDWPTPAVNDMGERKTPEEWDEWTARMRSRHANGNGHGPSLSVEARRSAPSPSPKSTPTPAPSSPTAGLTCPTSAPFSQSPAIQSLSDAVSSRLWSLVDFLASRTAKPDSERPAMTNATSGPSVGESFAIYDPASRFSRMSPGCSLLSQDFFSIAFCQTWPRFGTLASGTLYRQPTLTRPTNASASGSSASMNTASDAHTDKLASSQQTPGSMHSVTLPQAVNRDWPTATSRDWKDSPGMALEGVNPDGSHRDRTDLLPRMVYATERAGPPRTASGPLDPESVNTNGSRAESWGTKDGCWTTPCADDTAHRTNRYAQGGTALSTQASGKLNPAWVETLMGLPMGHTQLPHKFVKPKRGTP